MRYVTDPSAGPYRTLYESPLKGQPSSFLTL